MVKAFEETTGHLSMRLMAALDAGQAAGGDTRGMQSAAVLIVGKGMGVWLNNDVVLRLQVDDSPEPLKEMRRLIEGWNQRRAKNQQQPGRLVARLAPERGPTQPSSIERRCGTFVEVRAASLRRAARSLLVEAAGDRRPPWARRSSRSRVGQTRSACRR